MSVMSRQVKRIIASLSIIISGVYFRNIDAKLSSLIMVQSLSIVAFILSICSFRNYLRYERK